MREREREREKRVDERVKECNNKLLTITITFHSASVFL